MNGYWTDHYDPNEPRDEIGSWTDHYDPNEPRDEVGRWTEGPGAGKKPAKRDRKALRRRMGE